MTSSTASALTPTATSGLAPGKVVGGRFEIERIAFEDPLGTVYRALDQKTKRPIALRVLAASALMGADAADVLRAEIRAASGVSDRALAATYGAGTIPEAGAFVAAEWVDGHSLTEVVAQRKQSGNPLSLRGAYNVVSHVARALSAARAKDVCHGAVRPTVVWVTPNGRVKLRELGIAQAVLKTAGPTALGPTEQPFLAPEVKKDGRSSVAADVFGLGALLYTMLTGRSAADDFIPPSKAHPEASAEIDQILLRCLAPNPAARYSTPTEVRNALAPYCGGETTVDEEVGFDIDVDIDAGEAPGVPAQSGKLPTVKARRIDPLAAHPPAAMDQRPAANARPGEAAPQAVPGSANAGLPGAGLPGVSANSGIATGAAPEVGSRISIHEEFRPSLVQPEAPRASAVDLNQVLTKITENDAARWMVVKDKLDHGPFSGRELVQLVAKGEVLGEHGLLNMDTGERGKVEDNPDFLEFVEQYRLKQAQVAEQKKIVSAAKVEKASNTVKYLIGGSILMGVLLILGVFLYTRQAEQQRRITDAALADLYERGEIHIEGTAGILPDPPRRRSGSGGGHRSGGGGSPGGTSYEDAMNTVMDLGSAHGRGGEARLNRDQVLGVMNRHLDSIYQCVGAAIRGGSRPGRVRVDLAIAGSGQVLGSSVRAGNGEFQRCVQRKVAQVRFPPFAAARMGASFTFDAAQ